MVKKVSLSMGHKSNQNSVSHGKKKRMQLSVCKPSSAKPTSEQKISAPKKKSISNFVTAYLSNPNSHQS